MLLMEEMQRHAGMFNDLNYCVKLMNISKGIFRVRHFFSTIILHLNVALIILHQSSPKFKIQLTSSVNNAK